MIKLFKGLLAVGLFFMLAAGTGCQPQTPSAKVGLPAAPAHYVACFKKLTDIPVGSLTRDKVVQLVAKLRHSELAKSQCGKDLLAWYATVKTAFGRT